MDSPFSIIEWIKIYDKFAFIEFAKENMFKKVIIITETDGFKVVRLINNGFLEDGKMIKAVLVAKIPEP